MTEKLPLGAKIALIAKMVDDFGFYKAQGSCPTEQSFCIQSSDEDVSIETKARVQAFKAMASTGLKKLAFDTRRIDQETERNPRRNLQYWHRSQDFISDSTQEKLDVFAKLNTVVKEIESELRDQPEWFDSYARLLSMHLNRLQIKTAGETSTEVFEPHLSYLEQLVYNRYRLTLDDINKKSVQELRTVLFSKDEDLENKGKFLISTAHTQTKLPEKRGDTLTQEQMLQLIAGMQGSKDSSPKDALAELFGGNGLRRSGEKTVERTITIRIVENVVD